MSRLRRLLWATGLLVPLAGLAATALAPAETCMSPFVKRLDRPEKYLYLFCVDADANDNDFVTQHGFQVGAPYKDPSGVDIDTMLLVFRVTVLAPSNRD